MLTVFFLLTFCLRSFRLFVCYASSFADLDVDLSKIPVDQGLGEKQPLAV